jgi:serine protease Do
MRSKNGFLGIALLILVLTVGPSIFSSIGQNRKASVQAASSEKQSELVNIFVQISRKMLPSVVNIFTTATIRVPWNNGGGQDDLWRKFFEEFFGEPFQGGPGGGGGGGGGPAPKAQSLGSGFIIETSNTGGLILTNNHVVEGADEIKVKFTEAVDEKETDAELVGNDPDLDIAILKVKTRRKLQAVVLSDSDKLETGEWIAALGNPFGHGHSVSHGIVSAKERSLPGGFGKYLQVDAPINPGNSGGPLVNLNSEVVGINNAIDARGPGIGFAIPINLVKAILPQLKTKGKVERGYIGVSVDDLHSDLAKSLKLDENLKAPIITNVMRGQPADKAGLQAYDVITEVNGSAVHNSADLVAAITSVQVGEKIKVKVIRSGKERTFDVTVAKKPELGRGRSQGQRGKPDKQQKGAKVNTGMTLEQIDSEVARELGLPEGYEGIVVSDVSPGGPAYSAGLTRGDVILEVDRKQVKTIEQFYNIVKSKKTYLLRVRKQDENGREMFAVIALRLTGHGEE